MAVKRFEDERLETLEAILAQLEALKGVENKDFSTLEADVETVLSQLDITLSALRDALRGGGSKTLSDLDSQLAAIADRLGARTGIAYGQVEVSSSGVTQLPSQAIPAGFKVVIKALSTNNGKIYIGDSSVTTSNGFELTAGEWVTLAIDNLNRIYAIADSSGQKLCWIVEV
jgi:hypothetical protein